MGIDEQCGLGTFGSSNKYSGGLNQYPDSVDYTSAGSLFPSLSAMYVRRYILSDLRVEWMDCLTKKLQDMQGLTVSHRSLRIKHC